MAIGSFGFGFPTALFAVQGLAVEDITLCYCADNEQSETYFEPFMDPFARSFLNGLLDGKYDHFGALVILRESPGALPAYHYACELKRIGMLPMDGPQLILCNLVMACDPAGHDFNRTEIERVFDLLKIEETLKGADPKPVSDEPTNRTLNQTSNIAVLGAPLGNLTLHNWIRKNGSIAFDQQVEERRVCAKGNDLQSALDSYVENPFAARQPNQVFIDTIRELLKERKIDKIFWQVDDHDDLWGWLTPSLKKVCEQEGCEFSDLGFLPRWPTPDDLMHLQQALGNE